MRSSCFMGSKTKCWSLVALSMALLSDLASESTPQQLFQIKMWTKQIDSSLVILQQECLLWVVICNLCFKLLPLFCKI